MKEKVINMSTVYSFSCAWHISHMAMGDEHTLSGCSRVGIYSTKCPTKHITIKHVLWLCEQKLEKKQNTLPKMCENRKQNCLFFSISVYIQITFKATHITFHEDYSKCMKEAKDICVTNH